MAPFVPVPAPANISPVGFSAIDISIVFDLSSLSILILDVTSLKKFNPLILFIDLDKRISLNGSPSSTKI